MTRRELLMAAGAAAARPERKMWIAGRYDESRIFFLEHTDTSDDGWTPGTLPKRPALQAEKLTEAELFAASESEQKRAKLKPAFGLRPGDRLGAATANHGLLEGRLEELLIAEECGGPQPAALAKMEGPTADDFYLAWRKADSEPHYHPAGAIRPGSVPASFVEPLLKVALRDMTDGDAKAMLFSGKGRLETAVLDVPIGETARVLSVRAAWFLSGQPALGIHAWVQPGPPLAVESAERWWDMATDDSLGMEATQNLDDMALVTGLWTLDGQRYVLQRSRTKEGYRFDVLRRAQVGFVETDIRYSIGC